MHFRKSDFGIDFKWGVSTAAYQTEGAHDKDGKGVSIWDKFTAAKGNIFNNQHANTSCNFYYRYTQDITLMSLMNIPNYRFSISWSRIFPNGTGSTNSAGIDFYNRVIDFCLELNIEPWITLYHWDLPYELEMKGGWTNRLIIDWFGDYVALCIKVFGDRVKNWMIMNEPMVFTGGGHFLGIHAPGRKGLSNFLAAAHHAAICQAEGGRIARSTRSGLNLGTTFSSSYIEPFTGHEDDLLASHKVDTLLNRTFIEPLLGLGYPHKALPFLRRLEPFIKDGDENRLAFEMDFIGVQNYTRELVASSFFTPLIQARIVKANERKVQRTLMNWEVYPESIYHILKKFSTYENMPEIIVTENGAAFFDALDKGKINDVQRVSFIKNYLAQVLRAKNEGVNVNGYFVWSFTDNFEWAEGYYPRFGLVYVDFSTQQRIIKSSGHWYSEFLEDCLQKTALLTG